MVQELHCSDLPLHLKCSAEAGVSQTFLNSSFLFFCRIFGIIETRNGSEYYLPDTWDCYPWPSAYWWSWSQLVCHSIHPQLAWPSRRCPPRSSWTGGTSRYSRSHSPLLSADWTQLLQVPDASVSRPKKQPDNPLQSLHTQQVFFASCELQVNTSGWRYMPLGDKKMTSVALNINTLFPPIF